MQGTQKGGTAERLHDSARKLIEALDKDEDVDSHAEDVIKDLDSAETEEAEHLQRFEEIEKKLQGIASGTILSRHQEVVNEYKKKTAEFKKRAAAVKEAKKKKASKETIRQRTRSLIEFLETNKPKKKYELQSTANRLPWRVIAPGEMQLLGDASGIAAQPAVVTSTTPPSADDLSATADVQISPEIQNLAKSLDNHPLTIFRYVYNNYRYAPYYGSMKGSLDTYWEKEGNDYDLASLLIALLRASNIPARYVKAKTVVSVDKVKKWTGMNTAMAAIEYLSSAQIPFGYYTQGGAISHVEVEHVYVEAYVPYSNYRGTVEDASGKLWIPLDPSFKEERILQEGTDIAAGMGMDWKTFSDDYFSAVRNMTPREYYLERVDQYIAQNFPGSTLDTLKRASEIRTMRFDFLPNALPYVVTQVQGRFSALPQELRHRLRFNIPAVLDYSVGLPEAAGRRITLTFAGATPQDQAVIETFGTIFDTPPYLIKVKPVLRIDGVPAAEGSVMNAGIRASFNVEHTQPGGKTEVFDHHISTGSYNAVGVTIGNVRPEFLDITKVEASEEPYMSKMLHSLAMKYHDRLNQARQTLNDTMKTRSRTFITEALVSTRQDTKYNSWGVPVSFDLAGYTIDAKEMAAAVVSVEGYDKAKAINFAMIHGHEASYQENATFEDNLFWVTGLSAVKGLPILKAMGIEIRELEPRQTFENPNLPAIAVEDINNALNMGWKVIVPMETGGLPAVPYIKYDPATGGAGYMIASAAGGFTGYTEASTELLDMVRFSLAWWGPKQLLSMEFEALAPENDKTYVLGSVFFLHVKRTLRWSDGTVDERSYDFAGFPWGMWVRTGPWVFVSSGLPLPWWNPGRYTITHNGNPIHTFNVWGVKINSEATGKYLGIKTENNVDTIPNPMTVTYDIVGLQNTNPVSVKMKISDSANAEIRTTSLPLTAGQGLTTTWDGKNTGGQIVAPGEYSFVIEAEDNSGNKAKSIGHTVKVFKVEIHEVNTPSDTATPPGDNSFVAPSDLIEVKARIVGATELEGEINWRTETVGNYTGQATPQNATGAKTFQFNARSLQPTTGSTAPNDPLAYTVVASITKDGTITEDKVPPLPVIKQEERDIIRQEYIDYGATLQPARGEVVTPSHADFNKGNYSLIIEDGLSTMYSGVTAEYNRLIRDDVQEIAVGTTGLAPNAVVISPGATIHIVGALLSTRPAGDDQIVNRNIVAGANGIAETTANNEVGTAQYGLTISSAYRNPQRNRAVGSLYVNSYHVQGKALDLVIGAVPGITNAELYCILEQAGNNQGYYSLPEQGATPRPCNDATVDHVHFDNR